MMHRLTPCSASMRTVRRPLLSVLKSVRARQFTSSNLLRAATHPRHNTGRNLYVVADEVTYALALRKPVVALETTIYTHGFPYPDNLALAAHLESVVRANGGVPATIGVLNGVVRVGLTAEELTELVSSEASTEKMKVSIRDLPFITGLGLTGRRINGGTTVAATALLASNAGISVFATGGLGGVHRGGQDTMDVSADLNALGSIPLAVVSSGCKSFLDIPRTLEYLETQGVAVATFADGRAGSVDFPAFWTRESGLKSPLTVQNAKEAAAILFAHGSLGNNVPSLTSRLPGLLFANPVPEKWALAKVEIDAAINSAVNEAAEQGIHGHRNTPFILSRIKELTDGKSIPANRALIESNVAMGTKMAVELEKLKELYPTDSSRSQRAYPVSSTSKNDSPPPTAHGDQLEGVAPAVANSNKEVDILVAGSVALDLSCNYAPFDKAAGALPLMHTSNPAVIERDIGGVGFNVALAAHRTSGYTTVKLCTRVADDAAGTFITEKIRQSALDDTGIKTVAASATDRTAQYVAVNDANKDLHVAMADMDIFGAPHDDFHGEWQQLIDEAKPKWVVVDANWHVSAFMQWVAAANAAGAKVAFEPVSVAKSQVIFPAASVERPLPVFPANAIHLATPNIHELAALHAAARAHEYLERDDWWTVIDALGIPSTGARDRLVQLTSAALVDAGVPQMAIQLLPFIPTIITKLGADGCLVTELLSPDDARLTSPAEAPYILSRCGNGSSAVGGVYMRHHPAEPLATPGIVSVNGAGDTFLGVLVAQLAAEGASGAAMVKRAQQEAVKTLSWSGGVNQSVEGKGE